MLKIHPKYMFSGDYNFAAIDSMNIASFYQLHFTRDDARQIAQALIHFASHGTFCPEPVKPIEWTDVTDKIAYADGWLIRPQIPSTGKFAVQNIKYGTVDCDYLSIDGAKLYAESRIRESTKETP